MPKPQVQIPLSTLSGGINRLEAEAGPDQCAEALDTINDTGYLRRRDGFRTVAVAAPHLLPCGAVTVMSGSGASGFTGDATGYSTATDRCPTLSGANDWFIGYSMPVTTKVGSTYELWDGFELRKVSLSGVANSFSNWIRFKLYYWNGSAWTEITSAQFHDTTIYVKAAGTTGSTTENTAKGQSLSRNGRVSWHRSQLTSWASRQLNSITAMWIRIRTYNVATGALATLGGTVSVAAPGIRAFHSYPVNGIFPTNLKGRRAIVIGSDRRTTLAEDGTADGEPRPARSAEGGAKLSAWRRNFEDAQQLGLVEDEGAGYYDVFSWPTWNDPGTVAGTEGAARKITKLKQDYDWNTNQFSLGSKLAEGLAERGAAGSSTTVLDTATILSVPQFKFERCVLLCTTGSGGGVADGEFAEIYKVDSNGTRSLISVYPAFSATPDGTNRFAIIRYAIVKTRTTGEDEYLAGTTGAHTIVIESTSGAKFIAEPASSLDGKTLHFEVTRHLEWAVRSGDRWSSCVDPVTGRLLLSNGNSGLLAYDGRRLRALETDTSSDAALDYAGILPDKSASWAERPNADATLLSKPPSGAFVVDYRGRIVVAGFKTRPTDVAWSAPGARNNIWPKSFLAMIRDSRNDAITGLATLDDKLVIFTRSAIHQGVVLTNAGDMAFQPISQGIGFTAHAAVAQIALGGRSLLVGPGLDGVYLYAGGQPEPILDAWDRVIPGGVNQAALGDAVAVALPERRWYVLAVAQQGSPRNNRILVLDYEKKAWWLWSAPFGVSSLAKYTTTSGQEALLVGTDDGHVLQMQDRATDDGTEIDGYALSVPLQPYGGSACAPLALVCTEKVLGKNETMDFRLFVDSSEVDYQSWEVGVARGLATYGVDVWGTAVAPNTTPVWADERMSNVRLNVRRGARGALVQYRVGGSCRWEHRGAVLEARQLGAKER